QKGLSCPTHTLSFRRVNHIKSCPPIYLVYVSYLPGNLRCISYLVPLRPPLEHALVQTFVIIIYHQFGLFYWLIYAHLHRRSFDSSNFSNWFILRNWCIFSVMCSLYYHSFTLQWD